jgi:hypothetical protein
MVTDVEAELVPPGTSGGIDRLLNSTSLASRTTLAEQPFGAKLRSASTTLIQGTKVVEIYDLPEDCRRRPG